MIGGSYTDYDVIVVGSGPAGGMCAYELSKEGLSVLVIEKEKLPRYKVCAGGLTKKAVDIIPEDFRHIVENQTYNIRTTLNYKYEFSKTTNFPIVTMVTRDKFDYFLIQKSVEKGACLLDRTGVISVEELSDHVLIRTKRGNFKSKVIVGADGVTSCVARHLGLRRQKKLGVAVEGELFPSNERNLSRYDSSLHLDFHVVPKGYGWIFPKRTHLSVGVYTTLPKIR
ncbi:MAG TPA: geranylgeranyl reductase family protein, partial [Thermodesulfobacteriota bacterium]|nr:geranylgeranyl reductase family protein [Thermodesulfobacteriota bacterium]